MTNRTLPVVSQPKWRPLSSGAQAEHWHENKHEIVIPAQAGIYWVQEAEPPGCVPTQSMGTRESAYWCPGSAGASRLCGSAAAEGGRASGDHANAEHGHEGVRSQHTGALALPGHPGFAALPLPRLGGATA
jgi:hypothetical protein